MTARFLSRRRDRLWGSATADRVPPALGQAVIPMRTRRQAKIEDLRHAVNSLPRDMRVAMLDGIRHNDIVVGAYTGHGGICPMLAAFRAGGRASCISFARAWDGFAFRGARTRLARRATRRELLVLTSHLEASLLNDDGATSDLGTAIAQHEELVQARLAGERLGETNRSPRARPGRVGPGCGSCGGTTITSARWRCSGPAKATRRPPSHNAPPSSCRLVESSRRARDHRPAPRSSGLAGNP